MSSYQVFLPDAEEIRDHHTTHNGLVEEDVDELIETILGLSFFEVEILLEILSVEVDFS